ncbi:hypothetical protein [Actinomyces israelii]|uniref:hypothetical protein n=1 Tax=Actinomyces israelii TaxID=1659 RepID=UPI00235770B7|nr:hypothetical protein [Actinomyces israelii]
MTQPVSRAARLLAAAAAAALAAGAFAGCSDHPGKAYVGTYADAGGTTHTISVSESDVQTAAAELSKVPGMSADVVLASLVNLQPLEGVAEEYGLTVTDDDAQEAIVQTVAAASGQPDDRSYSRVSIDVARSALISQALSSVNRNPQLQPAAEAARAVQASLAGKASPRYTLKQGDWLVPSSAAAPTLGGSRSS